MIHFTINDTLLSAKFDNKEEEFSVRQAVTFKNEKSAFARGSYNVQFVRDVCFLKYLKKSDVWCGFAGLAKEIFLHCKQNKIPFEVEDKRTHFAWQKEEFDYHSFFDSKFTYVEHQISALKAMQKTNRGIIKAPTSAGKTLIVSTFIKMSKVRTLILVDRATLAKQTFDVLQNNGIDCGLICSGSSIEKDVTISTVQSVKKICREYDCVIIDECHKASSKSFTDYLKKHMTPLCYGFSASPFNGQYFDFATIRQFLGSIIYEIQADNLVQNKVITPPRIKFVSVEAVETVDYNSAYEVNVVNGEERNKRIIDIANSYDKYVCILVSRIEHGQKLEQTISGSKFIDGTSTLEERQQAINDFEEGKIRVLIGSTILNEGISINQMFVLIIASAMKANTLSVQRIGRAVRVAPGKEYAEIFDFDDFGNRFLQKHSNLRRRIYEKEWGKQYIIS